MILITGATGKIGGAAVKAALAAKVPFRALVHSQGKAGPLWAQGVDVAVGDMRDRGSLAMPLRGVTGVFLISEVSPALVELERTTLAAAAGAGVTRIVKVSAYSVGTRFQAGLGDLHAAAESVLQASGLEWTVLRPAATMGTPLDVGLVEKGVLYAPCANAAAAYCAPEDVGALGLAVLQQPGHAGKVYPMTGPEALDLTRVAAIVSELTGHRLRYEPTTDDDYKARLTAAGKPAAAIGLSISFFQRVRAGAFLDVLDTTLSVLGRPATRYADWVKSNAARLALTPG
jgi:uncharacterized protein YbjT (DUF2867 family)